MSGEYRKLGEIADEKFEKLTTKESNFRTRNLKKNKIDSAWTFFSLWNKKYRQ